MQISDSNATGRSTGALAVFDQQFLSTLADAVASRVIDQMSTQSGPKRRLLTAPQAAEYIGRSRQAVYHLIAAGKLRETTRHPRLHRPLELDKWIDDLEQ